jgi:GntR family transcriptional regulator
MVFDPVPVCQQPCRFLQLDCSGPPFDDTVPVALYQRIAEELAQKVTSGTWPVGALFPTEHQLMDQYGASRNTIRAALKQLQDIGMVSRRRNRGTMVEGPPASGAFTQSLSTLEDLVSLAQTATREISATREVVLDIRMARELGIAPGSRWLHIAMIRREAGAVSPLGWTDAYADPRYAGLRRLAIKHPDQLLCDLIEKNFGRPIATVEQTVTACAIPDEIAEKLGVATRSPGLRITRHYRDPARVAALITRSFYPGDRYALSTTLVRRR